MEIKLDKLFKIKMHSGNAWVVENIQAVNNPDEEIETIRGQINPNETAVINKSRFDIPQGNLIKRKY